MVLTVELREDLQEALELLAEREGCDAPTLALRAIEEYLARPVDRKGDRTLDATYAAGPADLLRMLRGHSGPPGP